MLPQSVRLDAGAGATVEAVTLETARLTPAALLERSVGARVGVIREDAKTGAERLVEATVLSAAGPVLEIDGRIETGTPGRLVFFERPAGLHPRPTLTATIAAGQARETLLALAYLTHGLGWQADYTATLAADGETLELAAWASLRNDTGADFAAAEVALVAGEVRTGAAGGPPPARMMRATAAAEAAPPVPEREGLASYHLYTLPGRIDLGAGERRQVALRPPAAVGYARELVHRAGPPVWAPLAARLGPSHPELRLRLANRDGEAPWPAGTVRVYGPDAGGRLRFLGADEIGDVPAGGAATLTLGRAADVTVERTQTAYERRDERTADSAWRLDLVNGGATPAEVRVVETIAGDWRILEQSRPHVRDGGAAVWTVPVPAGGTASLSYRVRVAR